MPQLSQFHQGTLDPDYSSSSGMGARLILRPLSVQERIRELNLRARHFAETVLAVQVSYHFFVFFSIYDIANSLRNLIKIQHFPS